MVTFQNFPVSKIADSRDWRLRISASEVHEQSTNYPLSLRVTTGAEAFVQFIYKDNVIDRAYVEKISRHFDHVLQQLVDGSSKRIGSLRLLDEAEERELLVDFNATAVDYPRDRTVIDLFEEQARKTPEATALIYAGQQLSYGQLDRLANGLARYLRHNGVELGKQAYIGSLNLKDK